MTLIWLPHHVYRARTSEIAIEAHIWAKLEGPSEVRRVLLARPAEDLAREPGGPCALKPLVDPRRQLEGLRRLARSKTPLRPPSILALIAPLASHKAAPDPVEVARATALAGELLRLGPKPSGRMAWLPVDPESMEGPLAYIASREPRVAAYLRAAARACGAASR